MTDDQRFEAWWNQVAWPQIYANTPNIVWRFASEDTFKQAAKTDWDAALHWQPPSA